MSSKKNGLGSDPLNWIAPTTEDEKSSKKQTVSQNDATVARNFLRKQRNQYGKTNIERKVPAL